MDLRRTLVVCAALILGVIGCGRAENSLLLLEDLPDVARIDFEGNHAFSDGELRGLMILRVENRWNPFQDTKYRKTQLETDLQAILTSYMRHGYLRARIADRQVRRSDDKVYILIRIEEGDPTTVAGVGVHGLRVADPDAMHLSLKRDQPADPFKLEDDRRKILAKLADLGYWEASVKAKMILYGDRAMALFDVYEGSPDRVDSVNVAGLHHVAPSVALRHVRTRTGEILRLRDILDSQALLLQSGIFLDAQWDTSAVDTVTHTIDVTYRVRERHLHWVEGGVGVNSQEQFRLSGEWGARSFLGTGYRFALVNRTDFDFSNRVPSVLDRVTTTALVTLPTLFGTRWEGQPNVFHVFDNARLEDVPDSVAATVGSLDYSQNVVGVGFSVRRQFHGVRNQVVFSLTNNWVNNQAGEGARNLDPQLYRDRYQTRLLSGRLELDNRSDLFEPRRGGYRSVLGQLAGGAFGGNNDFRKATVGAAEFRPWPGDRWVVGARAQVGYIKPSSGATSVAGRPISSRVELIPQEDRYRLGGPNTVRGYAQDELSGSNGLGGLAELLLNVETRLQVVGIVSVVGFLDAGNVWPDRKVITWRRFVPRTDRDKVSPYDVRYTFGGGLRLLTPVGPVRLDYARRWNNDAQSGTKDTWYVGLGHAF